MAGRGKIQKTANEAGVTPQDVIAYMLQVAGVSVPESAEWMGCSGRSIDTRRAKVKKWLQDNQADDFAIAYLKLFKVSCMPLAYTSLMHNLEMFDVPTTIAFLRGMGIFTDKHEVSGNMDYRNMSDAQLNDLVQRTVAEAFEFADSSQSPSDRSPVES